MSDVARLSDKQRLRIQTRHRVSVENYGYEPKALYWSDRTVQEVRFKTLMDSLPKRLCVAENTQIGNDQAWSLLDMGCGFADFKRYLNRHGFYPSYQGVDVSPVVVQAARAIEPGILIFEGELSECKFEVNQFDYVMLSGALNEVVETEVEGTAACYGDYARATLKKMYALCKQGVAFNLLDARHPWVASRSDLQSFLPADIVDFCHTFAHRVTLIEGYLDNDFTVYLHKS
ncbi:class I SAM-dependent methyltransferase [Thiomicrorhabdus aquaedulcis]|uniref:class I SAM-dependent methyltransferase n=1 Tax=Thiomicrorhabdus aquaedulcis TaxID=2211106 RepID=UPI000FDBE4B9|nr:class I SAM-dependent methyltransferase [Thiomicrorhabdus aquaedulcis]